MRVTISKRPSLEYIIPLKTSPAFSMSTTTLFHFRWLIILLLASFFCAGCAPSDNFFNTGRDGRIYNPATGRYEWADRN